MRTLGSETTHWPAKGIENGDRTSTYLSVLWRPHFPGMSAGKVLLTIFFNFQDPLLLHSSSTEGPLPPMCNVRQSKAYAGLSRKKDRSWSRQGWFCSMITHVHSCPGSHTWNGPSLCGDSLTIHPIPRTCRPVISRWLIPWKKYLKGQRFNSNDEFKDIVKD